MKTKTGNFIRNKEDLTVALLAVGLMLEEKGEELTLKWIDLIGGQITSQIAAETKLKREAIIEQQVKGASEFLQFFPAPPSRTKREEELTQEFIRQAKKVHGNKYDYTYTVITEEMLTPETRHYTGKDIRKIKFQP